MSNFKKILTIDGGGTGFRKAIVSNNEILPFSFKESKDIKNLKDLINFLKDDFEKVDGISFAIAGLIKNKSILINAPNISFLNNVNLKKVIKKYTNKEVFVFNDMEASSIGIYKIFSNISYFMAITWSTGIGIRILKNGEILANSEAGHINIDNSKNALKCDCGLKGCLETILGGKNIEERVKKELKKLKIKIPKEFKNLNEYFIFSLDKKDSWAISIVNDLILEMARFISNMQTIFQFPVIVWKGSIAREILKRKEKDLRKEIERLIIDKSWIKGAEFYYIWEYEKKNKLFKNFDSFIGASILFLNQ